MKKSFWEWSCDFVQGLGTTDKSLNILRGVCTFLLMLIIPTVFVKFSIATAFAMLSVATYIVYKFFEQDENVIVLTAVVSFGLFLWLYFKFLALAVAILYCITVGAFIVIQECFFRASYIASNDIDYFEKESSILDDISYIFLFFGSVIVAIFCFDHETFDHLSNSHFFDNDYKFKGLIRLIWDEIIGNTDLKEMAFNNYETGKQLAKGFLTNSIGKYLLYVFPILTILRMISELVRKNFNN